VERRTRDELIGQDLVTNVAGLDVSQTFTHTKTISEHFVFKEVQNWEGFSNISITMDLWFGSPTLEAVFQNRNSDQENELMVRREREVRVQREIKVSGKETFQVCSSVEVLEDYPIRFVAIGRLGKTWLKKDEIKHILLKTGHEVLQGDNSELFTLIHGTVEGLILLRTSSTYSDVDKHEPCTNMLRRKTNWHQYHSKWSHDQ
jgi:hypothetical protein